MGDSDLDVRMLAGEIRHRTTFAVPPGEIEERAHHRGAWQQELRAFVNLGMEVSSSYPRQMFSPAAWSDLGDALREGRELLFSFEPRANGFPTTSAGAEVM